MPQAQRDPRRAAPEPAAITQGTRIVYGLGGAAPGIVNNGFLAFLLLYYNHVLHVSLMHRRDLLEKTGLYNEDTIVLRDWDMTRRLVFFSDFYHVPEITGEFYQPAGKCDRISVLGRKDERKYARNILKILYRVVYLFNKMYILSNPLLLMYA